MTARWAGVGLAILLAGCEKPGTGPGAGSPESAERAEPPTPPPVVIPVETHPFEDGYNVGYEAGTGAGKPKAPIPPTSAVESLAREAAAHGEGRTERWQRGFVEGYIDGFRKVVTGQK
ncbi:MAG: hypothetical protein K8R23_16940 [Chthoniobacter sp.]|nr:hypothetical protein [Chthoniobacter sp.]